MAAKKKKKVIKSIDQPYKFRRRYRYLDFLIKKERNFLLFIALAFVIIGIAYPYPRVAMWIGFAFAGYSAIANDSIQTIGTFIASNLKRPWWVLWLFMGGIFLVTTYYSWYTFSGDVTYQRLASKGLNETPTSFVYLQLAAPVVLLILTRFRIPVSTTFMLLSVFSGTSSTIMAMFTKSALGYAVSFVVAMAVWIALSKIIRRAVKGEAHGSWLIAQWLISGALWGIWLMQDAANIAVYLPRQLSFGEYIAFASYIFIGLGLLFYLRGDRIQNVINEKTDTKDVRSATLIDSVYATVLFFFGTISTIPMSTTWVFIGLLAGRELGIKIMSDKKKKNFGRTFQLIIRDISSVTVGLIISVALAIAINPTIQKEIADWLAQ